MKNPVSTYRIQFHKNFTFRDFERCIPYLHQLGIGTLYASPIFEAVPGSLHGYDSVNPLRINPEIGSLEQLHAISRQLRQRGIGWIQDIVPNHMAFHPHNTWLMDVLEKGRLSLYADFFDIDWSSPVHHGRLMVPFLGASLEETLARRQLTVATDGAGKFVFRYADTAYPLHLRSYQTILKAGPGQPTATISSLLDLIDETLRIDMPQPFALRLAVIQTRLAAIQHDPTDKPWVDTCLQTVNANPSLLHQIADGQVYRLCFHGETDYQINYRRFFTVNSLICLNVQTPAVFAHVHQQVRKLLDAGVFQGLRVDHIDGLYDPSHYLEQLRELAGDETYIVVEKILKADENLPTHWPVQGTTGYGYLAMVNNLFTKTSSEARFSQFYHQLLGEKVAVRQELHDKKAYILFEHMGGELDNLDRLFVRADLIDEARLHTLSPGSLRLALGEFLVRCPVYRYYSNRMPLPADEAAAVRDIFDQVRRHKPALRSAADLLEEAFVTRPATANDDYRERARHVYQRCMQFTGPLMAKGVEDTLMYTYTRFIGHDEVGDSPEFFGLTIDDFHQRMIDRRLQWPLALNATATHDTKRGEDVRSRLNVLTDWVDEWVTTVMEWQRLNQDLKQTNPDDSGLPDEGAPDVNDEYFIYQTLVGAYPMPGQDATDFPNRLSEYLQKALREAKRHSTYTSPNESYEAATNTFALRLLEPDRPFWASFQAFHRRVADAGILNSLAQVVLKCTCPGLPDVYQGCENWDLSLVDPDNRRPVDFDRHQHLLNELLTQHPAPNWRALWQQRYDARPKLWLVHQLLTERQQQPDLFAHGTYLPLRVEGRYAQHILAFARQYQQTWYVVAVPLGLAQLCRDQQSDGFGLDWADTRLRLPDTAPDQWEHRLTAAGGQSVHKTLPLATLFHDLPLAVVKLTNY